MWKAKRSHAWQRLRVHVVCRSLGQRGCKRCSCEAATVCSSRPFPKGLYVERIGSYDAYLIRPTPTPPPRALHASGTKALRRSPQPSGASIHLLTQRFLARARGPPRVRGAARTGGSKATRRGRSIVCALSGSRTASLNTIELWSYPVTCSTPYLSAGSLRVGAFRREGPSPYVSRGQGRVAPACFHEHSRAEQSRATPSCDGPRQK